MRAGAVAPRRKATRRSSEPPLRGRHKAAYVTACRLRPSGRQIGFLQPNSLIRTHRIPSSATAAAGRLGKLLRRRHFRPAHRCLAQTRPRFRLGETDRPGRSPPKAPRTSSSSLGFRNHATGPHPRQDIFPGRSVPPYLRVRPSLNWPESRPRIGVGEPGRS